MAFRRLIAMLLIVCTVSKASQVIWLELTPQLFYRDLSTNCKTDGFFQHYFGAELDGSEVKAAVLKAGGLEVFHRSLFFEERELAMIRLSQDHFDRMWLADFQLNERVIRWLLQNSRSGLDGCIPSQPLTTATPAPFTFSFNIESLSAGPMQPTSNFRQFGGTRKDGRAYQAGLYFIQKQYID